MHSEILADVDIAAVLRTLGAAARLIIQGFGSGNNAIDEILACGMGNIDVLYFLALITGSFPPKPLQKRRCRQSAFSMFFSYSSLLLSNFPNLHQFHNHQTLPNLW